MKAIITGIEKENFLLTTLKNRVGIGRSAEVYRISEREVLKLLLIDDEEKIRNEFAIHQKLFNLGIKVPEPYEITYTGNAQYWRLGIMMEYIEGINPYDVCAQKKERRKILEEYFQEIHKCKTLGFKPHDEGLFNSLYSRRRGLFLIDFEGWEYRR